MKTPDEILKGLDWCCECCGRGLLMTTGELIKAMRIEKGLTQKQLGDLCGMADSAIRRYESGRGNPTEKTLKRIAKALNEGGNDECPYCGNYETCADAVHDDGMALIRQIMEEDQKLTKECRSVIDKIGDDCFILSKEHTNADRLAAKLITAFMDLAHTFTVEELDAIRLLDRLAKWACEADLGGPRP